MAHSRGLARATLVAALLLGLLAAALLPDLRSVKASPAQAILSHVVISQFRTGTILDGGNDFVEIFNATSAAVAIGNWTISTSTCSGVPIPPVFTFPTVTLQPGQYYLIAGVHYLGAKDGQTDLKLDDDGGILLADSGATPVDQVGMCSTDPYVEMPNLAPVMSNLDWSYQRVGGACTDTNHNASDFVEISPSAPHTSSSLPLTPCTDPPSATPTNTPTNTATPILPSVPAADDIVISEVRFSGSGGSTDEFIELFNRSCTKTFDLSSVAVNYSNGSGTTNAVGAFAQYTILAPGHFFLLGGPGYSGPTAASKPDVTYSVDIPDDGGVELVLAGSPFTVIDQVGLSSGSAYKEGTPAAQPNTAANQSEGRKSPFSGAFLDTNNNATDFVQQASDPRNSSQLGTCGFQGPTATTAPIGFHPRVMISEVGWAGTRADHNDQWIELYNPTAQDQDLTGWSLETTNNSLVVNLRGTLPSHAFYLLVHGATTDATQAATSTPTLPPAATSDACLVFYRSQVNINQVFDGSLSFNGQALYLINASNGIEDSADRNGGAWPAGNFAPPKSMERSSPTIADTTKGAWFTYDGDTTSTPLDCSGLNVAGSPGQVNWAFGVTATPSPTPAPTKKPTPRPPTPFPHMVINEFLPRAGTDWNQDGSVNVSDEFIELKNLGPIEVNVSGWKIDVLASGPAASYSLPAKTLQPGERVLYYGSQDGLIQPDSGATVRLWNNRGVLIDARSYGPVADADVSHCRIPDGYYWQDACFPTPGTENSLIGTAPAPPPALALQPPPCLLADIVPQPFRDAECSPYGAGIFNPAYWDDQAGLGKFLVQDIYSKWRSWVQ